MTRLLQHALLTLVAMLGLMLVRAGNRLCQGANRAAGGGK